MSRMLALTISFCTLLSQVQVIGQDQEGDKPVPQEAPPGNGIHTSLDLQPAEPSAGLVLGTPEGSNLQRMSFAAMYSPHVLPKLDSLSPQIVLSVLAALAVGGIVLWAGGTLIYEAAILSEATDLLFSAGLLFGEMFTLATALSIAIPVGYGTYYLLGRATQNLSPTIREEMKRVEAAVESTSGIPLQGGAIGILDSIEEGVSMESTLPPGPGTGVGP